MRQNPTDEFHTGEPVPPNLSQTSGSVHLSFDYADLPLRQFARAQWRHGVARLGIAPLFMWAGVFVAVVLAARGVEVLTGPRWPGAGSFVMIGAGFGTLALFGGMIVRWTFMQRDNLAREVASGLRQGRHEITLSPEGVQKRSANTECRFAWPAIASIGQAPAGLVLRLGTQGYLPLPDAALPEGISREELLDRIHGWMNG
ncbi:MAG: YcxB family protein [Pseudomonadota bacterium]